MKKAVSYFVLFAMIFSMVLLPVSAAEDDTPEGIAVQGTPTIDGTIEAAWDSVPSYPINRLKDGRDTGITSQFRTMWQPEALYVLIEVNDSDHSFSGGPSVGDGMEVYFDLNNLKSAGFEDDLQAYFAMCADDETYLTYDGSSMGALTLQDAATVAMTTTDTGYIYEVQILMEPMETALKAGQVIGFDIQVNDQVSGESERSGAYGWSDDANNAWQGTMLYGNLTLQGGDGAASSAPASSADYVTDGLVAWYDGANNQNGSQDKNATVWKDASGNGNDFEVDISEEDNYWTDKSFHINSCRNYFPDALLDVVNGDTYTVEFAAGELEFPATDWVSLIISDNDEFSLFIRVSNDNLEYKYNDANKDRPMAEDGKELVNNSTVAVTFDINSQDCWMYVDGVLVSENVPTDTNIADTLFLGHESEQRNWLGDVYAVRFYNRVLTPEEIAQNAAADNAKYRGGAALPIAAAAATEKPAEESRGFKKLADAAASVGMTAISGYEWEDGTNGFGGEGPENLWDGDVGTKFCTNEFPAESEASLDATYKVTGFNMATANDNAEYNGRSPNAWTISVSADGENWTELAHGDDSFFEEKNQTYYNGEGTAENVAFVRFEAEGTASGTFQVSELTLYGEKTGEKPAKAEPEPAPEPEPEPEPETPTVEEVAENAAENVTEAVENAAEAVSNTAENAAEAVNNAVDSAKSGCGSFIGGGLIVLVSVIGSAWIARRK